MRRGFVHMPYKLTPKQRFAARLIAEGELDMDIEKRLKMRSGTLDRWRRIAAFCDVITRHATNLQEVMPRRIQAMQTLSISAACAELAYQPDSKVLQQVHRVITTTQKLSQMEMDASNSGDETMKKMVADAQQAAIPQLFEELNNASEKIGIDLNASERRRNAPNPPEIPLANPEAIENKEFTELLHTLIHPKDNPEQ